MYRKYFFIFINIVISTMYRQPYLGVRSWWLLAKIEQGPRGRSNDSTLPAGHHHSGVAIHSSSWGWEYNYKAPSLRCCHKSSSHPHCGVAISLAPEGENTTPGHPHCGVAISLAPEGENTTPGHPHCGVAISLAPEGEYTTKGPRVSSQRCCHTVQLQMARIPLEATYYALFIKLHINSWRQTIF